MKQAKEWTKNLPWRRIGIVAVVALPLIVIAIQLAYPFNQTMLFARVDGIDIGGIERSQALDKISKIYQEMPIEIYFGDSSTPYRSPSLQDLDFTDNSEDVVDSMMYPWWLRLVPTSILWSHYVLDPEASRVSLNSDTVRSYVSGELSESCAVAPKNASVVVGESKLELVPAERGGTCELDDAVELISAFSTPRGDSNRVHIPLDYVEPEITNADAQNLIDTIESQLVKGVKITYDSISVSLDSKAVRSWMLFEERDGKLALLIDNNKVLDVLTEKLQSQVVNAPGVVTITTLDFQEISRSGGGSGQAFNVAGTAAGIAKYLIAESDKVPALVTTLQPQVRYIRSYSSTDTGLSAMIQHYAESRPGVYGVSLIELSGQKRRAGYNQDRVFFPASTYKIFVAYSVLRLVESGQMKWSDHVVGGRNLATCFDDMIVRSDNACPEELSLKIGKATLNAHLTELGLAGSRFIARGEHRVTAEDLSKFMANLQTGQMSISNDSRDRLISALRRNIFRQGIPAGVSGAVANKVGFLNSLLHDTAIVNTPSGTYILTILTNGSSWANIAELTRQISKLREQ